MTTVPVSHEPEILSKDRALAQAAGQDWAIRLSVNVNADARRIFQALTVPEYIETWMVFPGQTHDSMIEAAEEENGFRLNHFAAGRKAASIRSSYLFRHQRKMRMFWSKERETGSVESIVDFRLRGNFGCSLLQMRHTAIDSFAEFDWHLSMWRNSLGKLASLLRSA